MAAGPARRRTAPGDAWFCVRRSGNPRRSGWTRGSDPAALVRTLTPGGSDIVEVCIVDAVEDIPWRRFSRVFTNRARGVLGMECVLGDHRIRYAPTRTIATNRSFARTLDRFLARHGATREDCAARGALRALSARQYLVRIARDPEPLSRGTTAVPPRPAPDENRALELADGVGG